MSNDGSCFPLKGERGWRKFNYIIISNLKFDFYEINKKQRKENERGNELCRKFGIFHLNLIKSKSNLPRNMADVFPQRRDMLATI